MADDTRADHLEQLRDRLLEMQRDLRSVGEMARDSTRTVELDQTRFGRLSRVDALQSQAMSLEIKRRREHELQRIEAALARFEAGEYGLCTRCEEEIGVPRLQANPTAVQCIECASRGR